MFVNPNNVLKKLGLRDFMKAADFGCGSGSWVLPLAQILEEGSVFAVDVQQEPLSALSGKAKHEGLQNITTIIGDLEEKIPDIKDDSLDLVIIANTLFQFENKTAVFSEAKRVLKKGGKLLVVDWKIEVSLGPKQGRISKVDAEAIAKQAGFAPEKDLEQETGIYHYGLVFIKS